MQNGEPQPAAALSGASRLFGRFAALRNVSIEFAAGSSTIVVGDNGAGKSTLLRLIAGLLTPSRGTVLTFGQDPRNQRRRIGYMSHESMLYDELSGLENLRYFARLYARLESPVADAFAGSPETALRAVGLDPTLSRPVGQYSQGMRQRASLARVLLTGPELLLLDEPFSNLDVVSAAHIVSLLQHVPCCAAGWLARPHHHSHNASGAPRPSAGGSDGHDGRRCPAVGGRFQEYVTPHEARDARQDQRRPPARFASASPTRSAPTRSTPTTSPPSRSRARSACPPSRSSRRC